MSKKNKTKQIRTIGVSDTPVSFKVPEEFLEELREVAAARGVSETQLVRTAVMHDVAKCPTCGVRTKIPAKASRAA